MLCGERKKKETHNSNIQVRKVDQLLEKLCAASLLGRRLSHPVADKNEWRWRIVMLSLVSAPLTEGELPSKSSGSLWLSPSRLQQTSGAACERGGTRLRGKSCSRKFMPHLRWKMQTIRAVCAACPLRVLSADTFNKQQPDAAFRSKLSADPVRNLLVSSE